MTNLKILAAAFALIGPPAGVAAAEITPEWLARPSPEQIAAATPSLAKALSLRGRVLLRCEASGNGVLADCIVAEETPRGLGLGPAALALAPRFRLRSSDGQPVSVAVPFEPATATAMPSIPAPTSPRALILAREMIAARRNLSEALYERYEREVQTIARPAPGVEEVKIRAGVEALRSAAAANIPMWLEASASIHAAYATEEQLEANVTFSSTAAGRNYARRENQLNAIYRAAGLRFVQRVAQGVADRYCPTATCALSESKALTELDRALANPQVPSEPAMVLARQIVEVDGADIRLRSAIAKFIGGLPQPAMKEAADASVDAAAAPALEEIAKGYAQMFSTSELTSILAFKRGPAGEGLRRHAPELEAAFAALQAAYERKISSDARATFCAVQAC